MGVGRVWAKVHSWKNFGPGNLQGLARAGLPSGEAAEVIFFFFYSLEAGARGALGKATAAAPDFILARSRPLSRLTGNEDRSC